MCGVWNEILGQAIPFDIIERGLITPSPEIVGEDITSH
jgi:hypothetical protein